MKKILILAANPRQDLDLRREIHILKSVIERSQAEDEFEVKIGSGVSSDEIQELFLKHKPRIVHFCGHGAGKQGLVFEDAEKSEKLVSNEALSDLFKHFANQVECVLLNACYSEIQATEISHHINYVIGMEQAIRDDAAIVFARGFYQALGYGRSIEDAYNLGCNAIKLQIDNIDGSSSVSSEADRKFINRKLVSQSLPEHLKQQLYIKSPPTRFPDEEILTSAKSSPDLIKLVQDEINRKRYREDIEDDFQLGINNVNRGQPLTHQEYRWRQVLLSKVKENWIKGVLEKSLFTEVLFEQKIKHRPDAVEDPFSGFEEFAIESDKSFEFIQVSDIFEGMGAGRTLLILGEPGTGKTVSLLKLAERLIKKTEEDLSLPIPVVFNLSSWAIKRKSIADWLVEELWDKYKFPKALSKQWIEQEELILLLDGLDEVKAEYRNDCVKALNKFLNKHGITETVVCCRVQDYEVLSEQLSLRNAICIQPLSSEYINWYLDDIGEPLLALKQLLQRDKELEEFARTPLIFNVMSIVYQNYSLEKLEEEMSVKEKRYERLFNSYIQQMFKRKKSSLSKKDYKNKTIHYLAWLAKLLKKEEQIIFFIEKMQSSLLLSYGNKIKYIIINLIFMLIIVGITQIFIFWISTILIGGFDFFLELLIGILSTILMIFFTITIEISKKIILFEEIIWSWKKAKSKIYFALGNQYMIMVKTLAVTLGVIVLWGLFQSYYWYIFMSVILSTIGNMISYLLVLIVLILSVGLIQGIEIKEVSKRTYPNQGIWSSLRNSIKMTLIGCFIAVPNLILFLSICIEWPTYGFSNEKLIVGLLYGLIIGVYFGIHQGFYTAIQHFNLRRILYTKGDIPWNYSKFLDYTTESLFTQKVGGGFIFIHRMLMEHFANMKLD